MLWLTNNGVAHYRIEEVDVIVKLTEFREKGIKKIKSRVEKRKCALVSEDIGKYISHPFYRLLIEIFVQITPKDL